MARTGLAGVFGVNVPSLVAKVNRRGAAGVFTPIQSVAMYVLVE